METAEDAEIDVSGKMADVADEQEDTEEDADSVGFHGYIVHCWCVILKQLCNRLIWSHLITYICMSLRYFKLTWREIEIAPEIAFIIV